jgi:hypothetical protein
MMMMFDTAHFLMFIKLFCTFIFINILIFLGLKLWKMNYFEEFKIYLITFMFF